MDISYVMCLLNDYVYFITDIDFAFASSYWIRCDGILSYVSLKVCISSSISADFSVSETSPLDDNDKPLSFMSIPTWPLLVLLKYVIPFESIFGDAPLYTEFSVDAARMLRAPLPIDVFPSYEPMSFPSPGT